jgi:hypothetical protein
MSELGRSNPTSKYSIKIKTSEDLKSPDVSQISFSTY